MKRTTRIALGSLAIVIAVETVTRIVISTPPMYVAHQTIEYLMAPDQSGSRLGKSYSYNHFSMRSPDFPAHKAPEEHRLMLFGDSVVNGGSYTDQDALATSIVAAQTGWTVGNISAGGWGPANWLAYANERGFYDADVVGLVLSSHDFADVPTFAPLDHVEFLTEKPVSVLVYSARRYLPRLLPTSTETPAISAADVASAMSALERFLRVAQNHGPLVVFMHSTQTERAGLPDLGHEQILNLCARLGVRVVDLAPYIPVDGYVDEIHLNESGQAGLARAVIEHIKPPE